MNTFVRCAGGVALFAISSLVVLPSAQAVELGTSQAAADSERAPQPVSEVETGRKRKREFALEANPLGVFIGRYSIQAEWMPAAHHALVLNPHFSSVTVDATRGFDSQEIKYTEKLSGFGAELGYRFYTGSRGMNGFYVGPSLLVGSYSASSEDAEVKHDVAFSSIGGAIDIGGQAVLGSGFVIGGGFGLQYTSVSKTFDDDLPVTAAVLAGGGVRPRFLFSIGYAF
jgi:hypothetical protein